MSALLWRTQRLISTSSRARPLVCESWLIHLLADVWGKSLNLSKPKFPHVRNGCDSDNKTSQTCPRLLWDKACKELNMVPKTQIRILIKCLLSIATCQALCFTYIISYNCHAALLKCLIYWCGNWVTHDHKASNLQSWGLHCCLTPGGQPVSAVQQCLQSTADCGHCTIL